MRRRLRENWKLKRKNWNVKRENWNLKRKNWNVKRKNWNVKHKNWNVKIVVIIFWKTRFQKKNSEKLNFHVVLIFYWRVILLNYYYFIILFNKFIETFVEVWENEKLKWKFRVLNNTLPSSTTGGRSSILVPPI